MNPSDAANIRLVAIATLLRLKLLDAFVECVWKIVMLDPRILHSK